MGFNQRRHFFVKDDVLETDSAGNIWYRYPSDWLITRTLITDPDGTSLDGERDMTFGERSNPNAIGFPSDCVPMGIVYSFYNKNIDSWDVDFMEAFEFSVASRIYGPVSKIHDKDRQSYLDDMKNQLIDQLEMNSLKNRSKPKKTIKTVYPDENEGYRGYGSDNVLTRNPFLPLKPGTVPPTRAGTEE